MTKKNTVLATTGRIYIDGEIIPDAWNWWGDDATSLISVRNQVDALGEFDELEIYIFSPGGFCFEGWAIADYLLTLGKKLTTVAYGQCASIATIIYMVGSTRKITPNTDFMIHLPWGGVEGNEHQVLAYYNELVIEGDRIAGRYADVTAGDKVTIKAGMAVDNHMTGQQAIDQGYATELMGVAPVAVATRAKGASIKQPVAYMRRPKNVALKINNVPGTGAPIELTKPGVVTQQTEMANEKEKENQFEALLKSFTTSISNIVNGKPKKAMDVNTDAGTVIVIEETVDGGAIGDNVTLKETGAAAPDGDYTASESKTVYTVKDGKLSNIVLADPAADNKEGETTDAAKDKEIADLKQQLADLQAAQTTANAETTARLDLMAKALGQKQSKEVVVQGDKGVSEKTNGGQQVAEMSAQERKAAREAKAKENK